MKLVSIPANPVPEGAISGQIKTPDGAELRYARWPGPVGCKGTVCVFTGRGEYMEKYFETVHELRERGFAVAMIDWRGQGLSSRRLRDPRKGYVRAFSDFETDVETFVREIVLPDCPPPHFALAHSMGGAVMLRIDIDARGVPTDVQVVERSGDRDRAFDRAAIEAARQWRFQPATRNGEPVAATVQLPVEFRRG